MFVFGGKQLKLFICMACFGTVVFAVEFGGIAHEQINSNNNKILPMAAKILNL
jgi:hypothetical protein